MVISLVVENEWLHNLGGVIATDRLVAEANELFLQDQVCTVLSRFVFIFNSNCCCDIFIMYLFIKYIILFICAGTSDLMAKGLHVLYKTNVFAYQGFKDKFVSLQIHVKPLPIMYFSVNILFPWSMNSLLNIMIIMI